MRKVVFIIVFSFINHSKSYLLVHLYLFEFVFFFIIHLADKRDTVDSISNHKYLNLSYTFRRPYVQSCLLLFRLPLVFIIFY
jgi:hypothetical protein